MSKATGLLFITVLAVWLWQVNLGPTPSAALGDVIWGVVTADAIALGAQWLWRRGVPMRVSVERA